MATALELDPDTLRDLDDLVASGRFASRELAVRAAVRVFNEQDWVDEEVDLDSLDPVTRAGVEEGLADIAAGRTYPAEEVFDELLRELRARS